MALFQTPGWDVPDIPVADPKPSNSRKRKKSMTEGDGSQHVSSQLDRMPSVDVNLDKLMKKMKAEQGKGGQPISKPGSSSGNARADHTAASNKNPSKRHRQKLKRDADVSMMSIVEPEEDEKTEEEKEEPAPQHRKKRLRNAPLTAEASKPTVSISSPSVPSMALSSPRDESFVIPFASMTIEPSAKKSKKKGKKDHASTKESASRPGEPADIKGKAPESSTKLTPMQLSMKQSLEGGRFRYINELLYKSDSKAAHQMLREDPNVYEEYHAGFRQQVTAWPTNPVSHYISVLSNYPRETLVVDLGCGDALLAKSLIPKGFRVLSYDLVSDGAYVVEVDICDRLPLPGSDNGEGKITDVVVCALSLMSSNWLQCIREARRVLKSGGELFIAEVTSRFTNVDKFVAIISSLGFELAKKDQPTTHFTLFEFKAVDLPSEGRKAKDWKTQLKNSQVLLKPCEYKRR